MSCLACGRGFHEECDSDPCCCSEGEEIRPEIDEEPRPHARKDDSKLIDPKSTGRKRAAQLYPLDRTAYCEWRGLKTAGGNVKPIIGCINGKQQAIHHGPDKDTLVNELGNVHRICFDCHNRWHTLNDPGYNWNDPKRTKHDSETKATPDELVENDLFWRKQVLKDPTGGKYNID